MPRSPAGPPALEAERAPKVRSFHHSTYTVGHLAAARSEQRLGVSVCLPSRECAATIGHIVGTLTAQRTAGLIDQIVVVDGASQDGTAAVAADAGAEVLQESALLPSFGPVLGKGDAMWRALSVLTGELVCFLDADSEGAIGHYVPGLLGPLLCEPPTSFVKAFYRRPLTVPGSRGPRGAPPAHGSRRRPGAPPVPGPDDGSEGGRVNHLAARPALRLFYPQLADVRQPLAGEIAARRELLVGLPFATGYGVEIAMLIDVWRAAGTGAIAQVDLGEHHHHHQPLPALEPMADAVMATLAHRLEQEGRLTPSGLAAHAPRERPPLASLRACEPSAATAAASR